MVREEEKKLRIQRLKEVPRKRAFTPALLKDLHRDRKSGMSIRKLVQRYKKSTRTIQKYLKIEPREL